MTTTHMKLAKQQVLDRLKDKSVPGTYHEQTIEQLVDGWNWNLNIFEIYDEIRDWPKRYMAPVIEYAYHYFDQDVMVKELASHLNVDIE